MLSTTTKTDIAKTVVSMIVARKATDLTGDVICNTTDIDPDSMTVEIGSYVVGATVAYKARPLTDKLVDTTIERYQSWRQNRKEKTAE